MSRSPHIGMSPLHRTLFISLLKLSTLSLYSVANILPLTDCLCMADPTITVLAPRPSMHALAWLRCLSMRVLNDTSSVKSLSTTDTNKLCPVATTGAQSPQTSSSRLGSLIASLHTLSNTEWATMATINLPGQGLSSPSPRTKIP